MLGFQNFATQNIIDAFVQKKLTVKDNMHKSQIAVANLYFDNR